MKKYSLLILTFALAVSACAPLSTERAADNSADSRANAQATPTSAASPRAATPPQQVPYPNVARISLADAKKAYDAGLAVLVDTHSPEMFANERIEASINMPFNEVESYLSKMPKDKMIITYCSCPVENTSSAVADQLVKKGFKEVFALQGGTNAWKAAGYPMFRRGGK